MGEHENIILISYSVAMLILEIIVTAILWNNTFQLVAFWVFALAIWTIVCTLIDRLC